MPTQHSHWLRGYIRDGRVSVLLNGARLGSYTDLVDKDITMKLRSGLNFVTFVYEPNTSRADAHLEIREGEHNPPIAPLVTFAPFSSKATQSNPLRQTERFIAQ